MLSRLLSTAARSIRNALEDTAIAAKSQATKPSYPIFKRESKLVEALGPRPQGPYRRVTREEVEKTEKQVRWWNQNSGY